MKRLVSFLILLIYLTGCSFDNKTGIWEDAVDLKKIKEREAKKSNLKDVFLENKPFEEEKDINFKNKIKIDKPLKNKSWTDKYFSLTNNIPNIDYESNNLLVSKSRKLSKSNKNSDILYYENNIISYDNKGSVYIYSLIQKKKIFEYNFYKKKFKKYKKEANIAISNGNIYVSDNLGYIYSINITSQKLVWAKNLGIPFRSNIKVLNDKIFLADQDNRIYCLRSSSGEKIWEFATSLTNLKSDFKNNIALDEINNNVFFLNTSGELYSINYLTQRINWFFNLNTKGSSSDSSLFSGSPLVIKGKSILASNSNLLFNYDSLTGSPIWKKNIPTDIGGVITNNNVFLFTKNNLLICLDYNTGEVIWSKNVFKQIKNLDKKNYSKKIEKISNLIIAGDKILLFSPNGYIVSFNYKNGKIDFVKRFLKSGLGSKPIFSNGYMYLLDRNNKLFQYK